MYKDKYFKYKKKYINLKKQLGGSKVEAKTLLPAAEAEAPAKKAEKAAAAEAEAPALPAAEASIPIDPRADEFLKKTIFNTGWINQYKFGLPQRTVPGFAGGIMPIEENYKLIKGYAKMYPRNEIYFWFDLELESPDIIENTKRIFRDCPNIKLKNIRQNLLFRQVQIIQILTLYDKILDVYGLIDLIKILTAEDQIINGNVSVWFDIRVHVLKPQELYDEETINSLEEIGFIFMENKKKIDEKDYNNLTPKYFDKIYFDDKIFQFYKFYNGIENSFSIFNTNISKHFTNFINKYIIANMFKKTNSNILLGIGRLKKQFLLRGTDTKLIIQHFYDFLKNYLTEFIYNLLKISDKYKYDKNIIYINGKKVNKIEYILDEDEEFDIFSYLSTKPIYGWKPTRSLYDKPHLITTK